MRKLLPVIQFAHLLAASKLQSGGNAIDATAGNGNDTLFLINHLSKNSKLYIFDIQEDAIRQTKQRLHEHLTQADFNKLNQRLFFYCAGHQDMDMYVKEQVKVIMFNLGYLPGSQSKIITKPYTTLNALKKGLKLLLPNGLVSIILYPGHDGGQEEADLVTDYVSRLNTYEFGVIQYNNINKEKAPYLIAIEKKR
ncbi:tRNA (mnm(5)s(2)U34)-methyltransferase [Desulfuribacillus alkaliarsenatis]|uniref:16S rRNA (Cytosine(1402)-N(4))-methyltransferase n=1 Tax=Desulfuribacillus alkaliarsenatis TaxID=766136 RepID=A0A1E5G0N5_9FIRM|nr:class I SAM-dependent methyltransferase [Desulfuribacillus alkaliarsenatis]OEF96018.1 16S rRNA (cytosine(1402)-N(4))-methyltransferase [Desulfuribacillus alkaliarsenatis]